MLESLPGSHRCRSYRRDIGRCHEISGKWKLTRIRHWEIKIVQYMKMYLYYVYYIYTYIRIHTIIRIVCIYMNYVYIIIYMYAFIAKQLPKVPSRAGLPPFRAT